jgi:predicted MFS family arabinose efflux permease
MFDFKLLFQNTGFFLITLSNFFIFIGYFTPFLYVNKLAIDAGHKPSASAFLISIIGIVNIPFRMLFGLVADRKIISAVNLNTMCVLISFLSLAFFEVLLKAYWSCVLFSTLFAIGIGINLDYCKFLFKRKAII